MYIETPRMILRDFLPNDADDLYEILGDTETMFYCEPAYDLEKTQRFLTDFCIERKGAIAAIHRESGKLIGYILFHEINSGVYEIGWFFNRRFWGHGYACESCNAVIDYAFTMLNARKIFAETIDTTKSIPLMKKLGMKQEGIQFSQVTDPQGHPADLHLYGLLKSDWQRQAYAIQ